ncbi:MAG TPA: alpha/beta hydrolase [Thermoanaerobaculia bacterium]|nr:alpha/beta hydrolase [Thermoanaerobaculia bacterium]
MQENRFAALVPGAWLFIASLLLATFFHSEPLSGQPPKLEAAVRELNRPATADRAVGRWATALGESGPVAWGVTTGEYSQLALGLADRLAKQGKNPLPLLQAAWRHIEQAPEPAGVEVLPLLDEIVRRLLRSQPAEALRLEQEGLRRAEAAYGPGHPALLPRLSLVAEHMAAGGGPQEEILRLRERAAAIQAEADRQERLVTTLGGNPNRSADANAELVRVFFATNRERVLGASEPGVRFGTHRAARLSFGEVLVSVPREFEVQGLRDGRFWVGEIRKGNYDEAAVVRVREMADAGQLRKALRERLGSTVRRELLVFIHGFATDWETAIRRTAALSVALELDGVPFSYSWPSRGDMLSYVADGNELTSAAAADLGDLLHDLVQESGASRVFVVTHSMGARFLLAALEHVQAKTAKGAFSEVVFASPDVDARDFSARIHSLEPLARRFTLYASANDKALRVSKLLNDAPRAGDARSLVLQRGLDSVDTSLAGGEQWSVERVLRHNDFATVALDDLRALLWHGVGPAQRCILTPQGQGEILRWVLGEQGRCDHLAFKMGIHAARRLGAEEARGFLSVLKSETCRNHPGSADCRAWQASLRVLDQLGGEIPR